ncbi:MAG: LLM class F420-dependent oxidoreductase [Caulobacterales bacterium]
MKFVLELPVDHVQEGKEFIGQEALVEMAQTAEKAGFDGVAVTDHPAPTGRWLDAGGHYAQDPFVMLAMAGAVTKKIKLLTYLLVVPYRNPFLSARAVASLDVSTEGRVILGVGAGYLKGEFKALGVDFDTRNERFDQNIEAMRAAWENDEFTFSGNGFEALGNRILPRPLQKTVPMWIGGNSKEAIRRTVKYAQGWMPLVSLGSTGITQTARTAAIPSFEELADRLNYMKQYAAELGKTAPTDLIVTVYPSFTGEAGEESNFRERYDMFAKAGVTWAPIRAAGRTRKEWIENAMRGGEIIAKTR